MLKNMTRIRKWQVLTSIIFCLIANSLYMHAQTKDVVYATKKDWQGNMVDLKLDVYQPTCKAYSASKVVIWLHGGGMYVGHKSVEWDPVSFLADEFSRRGYVFVSIDYRLNPECEARGAFRETIMNAAEDLASAVDWVRQNAVKYRMDDHHIIIMGHSSGAEIAGNYYFSNALMDDSKYDKGGIVAVVSVSGNRLFFDGDKCTGNGNAHWLIVHGDNDDINPLSDAEIFLRQLGEKGEMAIMKGNGHTWTKTEEQRNFLVDSIISFLNKLYVEYKM